MKDYPTFIIDRSRHRAASRFSDDFVVCTDEDAGFIVRVYKLPKSRCAEFDSIIDSVPQYERPYKCLTTVIGDIAVALKIVHMFREPVSNIHRLPPLMKKALRAYVCG